MNKKLFLFGLGLGFIPLLASACHGMSPIMSSYTIVWANEDGTILETDTNVILNELPTYDGATPVKEGSGQNEYTFVGWDPVVSAAKGDQVYTARYSSELKNIKINFDLNGGTSSSNIETIYKKEVNASDFAFDLVKTDYKFRGWALGDTKVFNQHGDKLVDIAYQSEMTFKAIFSQDVEIFLDSNIAEAGKLTGAGIYEYGSNVDLVAEPLSGYKFVAWYNGDVEVSQVADYKFITSQDDLYLTAVFALADYKLSVNSANPLLGSVKIIGDDSYTNQTNKNVRHQEFVTVVARKDEGTQRFLGWFDDNGTLLSTNAIYSFDMPSKDYSLFAKWEAPSTVVEVNNDNSKGLISGVGYYSNGEPVTLVANANDGYSFAGFYKDSDLTELASSSSSYSFIMGEDDVNLYTKWTTREYNINYVLDGGINSSNNPSTFAYGEEINLDAPSKNHHNFLTWTLDNKPVTKIEKGTNKDITLVAKWELASYKVVFDMNGHGSQINDQSIQYNNVAVEPAAPTEIGYTFIGWFKDANCLNPWDFATDLVTEDTTLYAKWDVNKYDVKISVDGVDPTDGSVSSTLINDVEYGTAYSINDNVLTIGDNQITATPKASDDQYTYTFEGWFYLDGSSITGGTINDELEIVAEFSRNINTYSVITTVNNAGYGQVTNPALYNIKYGETITILNDTITVDGNSIIATPSMDTAQYSYEFAGWEINGVGYAINDNKSITLTGDVNIVAKFIRNVNYYVASFDMGGHGSQINNQTIDYGDVVVEPVAPTETGYTFEGWFIDSGYTTPYNFSTPVSGDITVYAKWSANPCNVTFDSQGGSVVAPEIVNYDSLVTLPNVSPTLTGHTFEGWYKEADCINPWDFNSDVVKGDMTLYAKWEAIKINVEFYIDANDPSYGGFTIVKDYDQWNRTNDISDDPDFQISTPSVVINDLNYGEYVIGAAQSDGNVEIHIDKIDENENSIKTDLFFALPKIRDEHYTYVIDGMFDKDGNSLVDNYGWYIDNTPLTQDVQVFIRISQVLSKHTLVFDNPSSVYPYGIHATGSVYNSLREFEYGSTIHFDGNTFVVDGVYNYEFGKCVVNITDYDYDYIFKSWVVNGVDLGENYVGNIVIDENIIDNNLDYNDRSDVYGNFPICGNVNISATYEKRLKSATVTYVMNGHGSQIANDVVQYDTLVTKPSDPTETGYTFEGWYIDKDFTTPFDFNKKYNTREYETSLDPKYNNNTWWHLKDLTLYAKWSVNSYTVSFNSNGGTSVASQTVDYNDFAVEPTAPTKTGYVFGGWFNGDNPWSFTTDKVIDDLTLEAQWIVDPYVVSYNTNGHGIAPTKEEVEHNHLVIKPTDPTENGYVFKGWYKEADFQNQWDFAVDLVTSDMTLYAKWEVVNYNINYDYDGGNEDMKIQINLTHLHIMLNLVTSISTIQLEITMNSKVGLVQIILLHLKMS